jgi:hypothetical protein
MLSIKRQSHRPISDTELCYRPGLVPVQQADLLPVQGRTYYPVLGESGAREQQTHRKQTTDVQSYFVQIYFAQ